jgi:23S rRNA (uracil1939-C5)-methyltransferase
VIAISAKFSIFVNAAGATVIQVMPADNGDRVAIPVSQIVGPDAPHVEAVVGMPEGYLDRACTDSAELTPRAGGSRARAASAVEPDPASREQVETERAFGSDAAAVKASPAGTSVRGFRDSDAGASGRSRFDRCAPWGFRHKAAFVFAPGPRGRGLLMGHYRRGSHLVVAVDECPVHAEAANRVAFAMRDELAAAGIPAASVDLTRGVLRHLVVRASRASGETLATLVVTENDKVLRAAVRRLLASPDAPDGLHVNVHDRPGPFLFGPETRHVHGRARLREEVEGVSFLVSPTAFFQTNVTAADWLVATVREAIGRAPVHVLDLYAGAGLFALPLAEAGHVVAAVEESRDAVEDGRASQRLNRIPDSCCQFVAARVETALGRLQRDGRDERPFEAVVLDPPRWGCGPAVAASIATTLRPVRVVYVSCDPEALARDLAVFLEAGYRADRVLPVDMFPHTPHVESVAVLSASPRRFPERRRRALR